MDDTGVWIVGARGNVATTAIVGARAIAAGATDDTGMVTALPPVSDLDLPNVEGFVFGGHDVRETSIEETAGELSQRGPPDEAVLDAVRDDLQQIDERVRTGTAKNCGAAVDALADDTLDDRSLVDVVEQIRDDVESFRRAQNLDRVVVVNLASTEAPVDDAGRYDTLDAFESALADDDPDLPASSLYAYAALVDGHPYVNFTPSTGASLGGLRELADERNVPHAGRDAKTGETLVKSSLAPMFAGRNLRVLSWEGHNILGNTDGEVLEDDANKQGKLDSKGDILDSLLPGNPHNRVRIDYTPSLGDWKTAWDYIHFQGFLDTEMTMEFTWEGADSALAAPLVLDLARLVAHADEHDGGGVQRHLAAFFKAPMGVDEHDFARQTRRLEAYARRHLDSDANREAVEQGGQ